MQVRGLLGPLGIGDIEGSAHAKSSSAREPDDLVEPWPDTEAMPSPLTDQSRELEDVLEHGQLSGADCDRYFEGEDDRETSLRCGKWMFFYANIDVPGSPAALLDLIRGSAPQTVGRSLEKLGLFPDPYSETELPVGMAAGPDFGGWQRDLHAHLCFLSFRKDDRRALRRGLTQPGLRVWSLHARAGHLAGARGHAR